MHLLYSKKSLVNIFPLSPLRCIYDLQTNVIHTNYNMHYFGGSFYIILNTLLILTDILCICRIQQIEEIVASFSPCNNLLTKIVKKIHESFLR